MNGSIISILLPFGLATIKNQLSKGSINRSVFHATEDTLKAIPPRARRAVTSIELSRGAAFPNGIDIICEFKNLKSLRMIDNGITSLPECIGDLINLESFLSYGNLITHLPQSMSRMNNLKSISVTTSSRDCTQPFTIPSWIGVLENLEGLKFNGFNLQDVNNQNKIPMGISNLKKLKRLSLQSCNIQSIPNNIGELESLEELYLSSNSITSVPESISRLANLEKLDISRNRMITAIPESIAHLPNLRTLRLDHTGIRYLPSKIVSMSTIRRLGTMGCQHLEITRSDIEFAIRSNANQSVILSMIKEYQKQLSKNRSIIRRY